MNDKMAGQTIFTTAPRDADYSHTTDTGRTVELDLSGRVHVLREVRLTDDEYLANYQYMRYGSFMGVTWTKAQLNEEYAYRESLK